MSNDENLSTKDKLLVAGIDLIAQKGYNGVTTQEIATAAGLSEKTLFRHFGSKQNLLETAYERFNYGEDIKKLFNAKLIWVLEPDLFLISRTFHEIMNRKRKMIIISFKEEGNLPGFSDRANKYPQQLMNVLTDYFTVMMEKGKIIQTNPELQAMSFMSMHFGAFMISEKNKHFLSGSLEAFITQSVQTFTRALTP